MDGFEIFEKHQWHIFTRFGLTSPYLALEQHTLIYTWVALAFITIFASASRIAITHYPESLFAYCIKKFVSLFMDNLIQTCHFFSYRYTVFIISLFTFLVVCNCLVVIPTFEEPTKDINTTLALAVIAFIFVQMQAIKAHGVLGYLNEFFKTPLQIRGLHTTWSLWALVDSCGRIILNSIIALLTFPIELLGKLASILSLSFRLFGNIFGGSVISSLWLHFKSDSIIKQLLALPFNPLLMGFFGIFEGLLQAFVFTMLTMMYLGNAIAQHPDEGIS